MAVFFLVLCFNVYGAIELTVPDLTAEPGAKITVAVNIDSAAGVAGGDFTLVYDPAVLTLKDVRTTDVVKSLGPLINTKVEGRIKVSMVSMTLTPLQEGTGAILEADFEVKADAKGKSPLTLVDAAMFDETAAPIPTKVTNGSVTIGLAPCNTPIVTKPGGKMLGLQSTYKEANKYSYTYIDIWNGNVPIKTGQFLEFQVIMFSGNPTFKGTVDLHTSDGGSLRDSGAKDQNGLSAHPATDLSKFARDLWYHRKISLDPLAGKTLDGVMIATDSSEHSAGVFRVYVDNIQITDGNCLLTPIYIDEDNVPITGKPVATGSSFAGIKDMSDFSVSVVGETPVNSIGKIATLWGSIKAER